MKIIVDGRPLTKRATGVAMFTIDAIRAISTYLPQWKITVVMPRPLHPTVEGLPLDKIQIVVSPFLSTKLPGTVWCLFKLPILAKRYGADILWAPNKLLPIYHWGHYKTLIIIHDVVWKEFKNTTSRKWATSMINPFFNHSVKNADYIWCNSKYTLMKTNQYFPHRKQMNVVIGGSCNSRFRPINLSYKRKNEILNLYGINNGYLLFVGSLEPRKNLGFLLKLMPEVFERTGYQLLVVGARGWKDSEIFSIVNADSYPTNIVKFADYVSNDLLVELYNAAVCYISTALNEGLGLPQLEAMSCGCPVISPHNSAMIEVVEGRGVTIKDWNEQEWIGTICKVVSDSVLLDGMRHSDLTEYDWENIIHRVDNYIKDSTGKSAIF